MTLSKLLKVSRSFFFFLIKRLNDLSFSFLHQFEHSKILWQWNKLWGLPIIKATFSFHFSFHRVWCPSSQAKSHICKTWTEIKILAKSKLKSSCHQKFLATSIVKLAKYLPRKRYYRLWSGSVLGSPLVYQLCSILAGRVSSTSLFSWSTHYSSQGKFIKHLADTVLGTRHTKSSEMNPLP